MRVEHVLLWTDAEGQTRWRWVAANGLTLGDSGQGYGDSRRCVEKAERLANGLGIELVDARS